MIGDGYRAAWVLWVCFGVAKGVTVSMVGDALLAWSWPNRRPGGDGGCRGGRKVDGREKRREGERERERGWTLSKHVEDEYHVRLRRWVRPCVMAKSPTSERMLTRPKSRAVCRERQYTKQKPCASLDDVIEAAIGTRNWRRRSAPAAVTVVGSVAV